MNYKDFTYAGCVSFFKLRNPVGESANGILPLRKLGSKLQSLIAAKSARFWIITGMLTFIGLSLISNNLHASTGGSYTPSTALTYCQSLRGPTGTYPSGLIQPLIECFTNSTQGIIPMATNALMTQMDGWYLPILRSMMVLLVAILGVNIITGFSTQQIKSELFVVALKIAGVLYFLANLHTNVNFYKQMLDVITGLSDNIAKSATQAVTGGFCVTKVSATGSTAGGVLWGYLDCIIGYLFGFNGASSSSPGGVGVLTLGICSFLLMMFISNGAGGLIFGVGSYMLFQAISLVIKFVQSYIECILKFSFVFWFGYLFVPLLMFRPTFQYFQRWMSFCLLYILQPVLMLGFLAISLVIMDNVFFTANYSVLQQIAGSSAKSGGTSVNAFTTLANTKTNMAHCYINLFITTYNGASQGGPSNGGPPTQNCNSSYTQSATTINGASVVSMNAGILDPQIEELGQPGSALMLLQSGGGFDNIGFDFNPQDTDHPKNIGGLDCKTLAGQAGVSTSTANPCGPYESGVAQAIATAALVMYILTMIADKIEEITGELVGGGLSMARKGSSGRQIFSENIARAAAGAGEGAAKGVTGG